MHTFMYPTVHEIARQGKATIQAPALVLAPRPTRYPKGSKWYPCPKVVTD